MGAPTKGVAVVRAGTAHPELSILMPLYRREMYVAAAVASVLAQRDVTAEVIISDDNSGDRTLERALQVVDAYQGPHRVVVRRGKRRLRRDHLPALVDLASCDVVMQAHDDDISHPLRARTVLDLMARTGAVLVGSEAAIIDEAGAVTDTPQSTIGEHHLVSRQEVLDYPSALIGSRLAWSRCALAPFGRLDTKSAAVLHDRLLSLRAAFVGPVAVAGGPLVAYRMHRGSWSNALLDQRSPAATSLAGALHRLSFLRAADRDLSLASRRGFVGEHDSQEIAALLDRQRTNLLGQAIAAHDKLASAGRQPLWVDQDELALANQGLLIGQLRARAARTRGIVAPAALVLKVTRAGRRRLFRSR